MFHHAASRCAAAVLVLALAATARSAQRAATHAFDGEIVARAPEGFTFAAMRQPSPGAWLVRRDGRNGALVHEADGSANGLSLALSPTPAMDEGLIAARIRFQDTPRAGGVVWRFTDAGNFYAAMLDLSRATVSLFRVAAGNRVFLEVEDGLELDPQAWHTLKVVHQGASVSVSLGGIRVFNERDRRAELRGPGRSGLIAAGDAAVWFDDFRAEPLDRSDARGTRTGKP